MTPSPNDWYAQGLRFSCTQCGHCCSNHGEHSFLYVMDEEVRTIAAHLDLEESEFRARHCAEDGGWQILVADGDRCTFLGVDNRCTIYPVRPVQCRTWPFWEDNLRQEVWEGSVQEVCPGSARKDGQLVPAAEAEAIAQATEAWYTRRGDWRSELAPLAYLEGELPPAVRSLLEGPPGEEEAS